MENDNYCILVYDKQTYFDRFFKDGKCIQDGLEHLEPVQMTNDCISSYFKFKDNDDTTDVYFVVHNFGDDIQNNILDEDMVVLDDFYNKCLPNGVKDKEIIIAGHWGGQATVEEYANNIIKLANQQEKNKKKNIRLSYYGTLLNEYKWFPEGTQKACDKKILELADVFLETNVETVFHYYRTQLDVLKKYVSYTETSQENSNNDDEEIIISTKEELKTEIKFFIDKAKELEKLYNSISQYLNKH